jgi:hypothetical protein
VPVVNTNSRVTIAAILMNGNCLIGQDIISHPPPSIAATKEMKAKSVPSRIDKVRAGTVALPSPIKKIFYVNQYGNEIVPPANVNVLKGLTECEAIIYAMGSLYTSIIPSLIVPGVGAKIKNSKCPKQEWLAKSSRKTNPNCVFKKILGKPFEMSKTRRPEPSDRFRRKMQNCVSFFL